MNRKPRGAKTLEDQYRHARNRAVERYGLSLTKELYQEMISEIQRGKASFLFKESNTRTHWLVKDQFIVVYDRARRSIATFLPPDNIHAYLPVKRDGSNLSNEP